MARTVKIDFGYEDETTRRYAFEVDDSITDTTVKNKIVGIKASLLSGTAGGMSSFFVSDDGENLIDITGAQVESTTTTVLDISGGASAAL